MTQLWSGIAQSYKDWSSWKRRHSWVAVAESGKQTSEPSNSQRNFTWGTGEGIHRSSSGSFSRIIHKDLRLLQEKARSTADWSAQQACVKRCSHCARHRTMSSGVAVIEHIDCSHTARCRTTSYNIVRHRPVSLSRPMSYDVVRSAVWTPLYFRYAV